MKRLFLLLAACFVITLSVHCSPVQALESTHDSFDALTRDMKYLCAVLLIYRTGMEAALQYPMSDTARAVLINTINHGSALAESSGVR